MIRIAIVDDDKNFRVQVRDYLQQYTKENGVEFLISNFEDGDEIVENYTAEYDIILMDIQMRFMNGMSAAEMIRNIDENVAILFLTNTPQFAIQGYKVNALDYIVKPIEYYAFSQSIERAISRCGEQSDKYLILSTHGGKVKVNVNKIQYLEVFDHDLIFHTLQGQVETKGSMNAVKEELEGESFYQCNKGCLVNLRYVDAVSGNGIMVGGNWVQISRSRKKGLMDALNSYMESMGI